MGLYFLLKIISVSIIIGIIGLWWAKEKLLYYPTPMCVAPPHPIVEVDIIDTNHKGYKISCWWSEPEPNKPTILVCHGNAGNNSNRKWIIDLFKPEGYGVLVFDYYNYGNSFGSAPSEQSFRECGKLAWKYLTQTKGIDANNIIIFTESIGCGPGVWLAKNKTPRALIVYAGFTNIVDIGVNGLLNWIYKPLKLLIMRALKLIVFEFQQDIIIQDVVCPTLFIHPRDDELIDPNYSRKLYKLSGAKNKKLILCEGGHNDGRINNIELFNWVDQTLSNLAGDE